MVQFVFDYIHISLENLKNAQSIAPVLLCIEHLKYTNYRYLDGPKSKIRIRSVYSNGIHNNEYETPGFYLYGRDSR